MSANDAINQPVKTAWNAITGTPTSGRPPRVKKSRALGVDKSGLLGEFSHPFRSGQVALDNNWDTSRVYQQQVFWVEFRKDGKLEDIGKKVQNDEVKSPGSRFALPNVQNVQSTTDVPSVVTYSTGVVAHVERSPLRDHVITISGQSGADMVYDPINDSYLDPMKYFDRIRNGIEMLCMSDAPTPMQGRNPLKGQEPKGWRMVLRSSFERFNHMVEPVSFTFRRSPTNRFSVQWSMTLRAYSRFSASIEETTLHIPKNSYAEIAEGLIHYGRNLINTVRIHAKYTVPGLMARASNTILSSSVGMLNVLDFNNWAHDNSSRMTPMYWHAAAQIAQRRFMSFYQKKLNWWEQVEWKKGSSGTAVSDAARQGLSMAEIGACMAIVGSEHPSALKIYPQVLDESTFFPLQDLFVMSVSSFENVAWSGATYSCVVKEGDTLETVALREMGNPDAWLTLAALNKMSAANMYKDGKPLSAGDVLLVPDPGGGKAVSYDQEHAYGVDLLLGSDGDLQLLNANADDVKLARGAIALQQGLTHRMLIKKGDSVVFPQMGLTHGPGDGSTFVRVADTIADVVDQTEADPRIKSCIIESAIDGGSTIIVRSVAIAHDGLETQITTPVAY